MHSKVCIKGQILPAYFRRLATSTDYFIFYWYCLKNQCLSSSFFILFQKCTITLKARSQLTFDAAKNNGGGECSQALPGNNTFYVFCVIAIITNQSNHRSWFILHVVTPARGGGDEHWFRNNLCLAWHHIYFRLCYYCCCCFQTPQIFKMSALIKICRNSSNILRYRVFIKYCVFP